VLTHAAMAPDALVFRRVRAVDPASGLDAELDVVVEGGTITRVGVDAGAALVGKERVRTFDSKGAWLLPGLIDLHVHLREPGEEYKEDLATGLSAAAAGGYVAVCAMPNTRPVNDTRAVTEMLVAKSKSLGGTRLHPIGAITVGQKGEALTEMADLKEAGAVAVSDDGRCVTSSAVMRRALEYAATFDLPVIQHAEDHALTEGAQMHEGAVSSRLGLRGWPRVAEDIIVARDVLLAEVTRARYHVAHVSSLGAVRILREAKSRGIAVTAEVTPHHLLLTDAALLGYDTGCKVNPPLRSEEDRAAVRAALADGTLDCIATDHAPHSSLEKDCEMAAASPGMVGLELCVPLLLGLVHDGALSLTRFVDASSLAPARVAGLRVPRIADGAPADLTLIDPLAEVTIDPSRFRSKGRNTPFAGRVAKGRVLATIVSGRVVYGGEGHAAPAGSATRAGKEAPRGG
jgi:dihydroorotase